MIGVANSIICVSVATIWVMSRKTRRQDRQRQRDPAQIGEQQDEPRYGQEKTVVPGENAEQQGHRNEDDDRMQEDDEVTPHDAEDVEPIGQSNLLDEPLAFLEGPRSFR